MTKNKLKQIFCELYDQFSEDYDDSQILKATKAMYDSLGDKYYKVDYSHRDYFFTGLPKAVDTAFDDPGNYFMRKLKTFQHICVKSEVINEKIIQSIRRT